MRCIRFLKLFVVSLSLVFLSTPCLADWTKRDTTLELSYQALHFIDWRQTRYIAKNGDDYYEVNPILGRHPDKHWVDVYFLGSAVAHLGISYFLPDRYRNVWQCVTIGVKAGLVGWNYSIGIRMEF